MEPSVYIKNVRDSALRKLHELGDTHDNPENQYIEVAFNKDIVASCLEAEVQGLLRGIAEGVITSGQPRLQQATVELAKSVDSWIDAKPDAKSSGEFRRYQCILHNIILDANALGYGIAGISFDSSLVQLRARATSEQSQKK